MSEQVRLLGSNVSNELYLAERGRSGTGWENSVTDDGDWGITWTQRRHVCFADDRAFVFFTFPQPE